MTLIVATTPVDSCEPDSFDTFHEPELGQFVSRFTNDPLEHAILNAALESLSWIDRARRACTALSDERGAFDYLAIEQTHRITNDAYDFAEEEIIGPAIKGAMLEGIDETKAAIQRVSDLASLLEIIAKNALAEVKNRELDNV